MNIAALLALFLVMAAPLIGAPNIPSKYNYYNDFDTMNAYGSAGYQQQSQESARPSGGWNQQLTASNIIPSPAYYQQASFGNSFDTANNNPNRGTPSAFYPTPMTFVNYQQQQLQLQLQQEYLQQAQQLWDNYNSLLAPLYNFQTNNNHGVNSSFGTQAFVLPAQLGWQTYNPNQLPYSRMFGGQLPDSDQTDFSSSTPLIGDPSFVPNLTSGAAYQAALYPSSPLGSSVASSSPGVFSPLASAPISDIGADDGTNIVKIGASLLPSDDRQLSGDGLMSENERKAVIEVFKFMGVERKDLERHISYAAEKFIVDPLILESDIRWILELEADVMDRNKCGPEIIHQVHTANTALTGHSLDRFRRDELLKLYKFLLNLGNKTFQCLRANYEEQFYDSLKQDLSILRWLDAIDRGYRAAIYADEKELARDMQGTSKVVLASTTFLLKSQGGFKSDDSLETVCSRVIGQYATIGQMMKTANDPLYPRSTQNYPVLVLFGAMYDFCGQYLASSETRQNLDASIEQPNEFGDKMQKFMQVLGDLN